jgi:hypothetical protein
MVRCTGCHRNFTVSGYTLHIKRNASDACITAYHAQVNRMNNMDGNVEVFSGDFVADYQEEDFEWPDQEQDPAEGS